MIHSVYCREIYSSHFRNENAFPVCFSSHLNGCESEVLDCIVAVMVEDLPIGFYNLPNPTLNDP